MHDNKERFKFVVVRRVVVPAEDGGMQTLQPGEEVHGAYYKRFVSTGVLRQVELAPVEPEEAPTAGTSSEPEPPAPAPAPEPEEEPEAPEYTREALESKTKTKLQALAEELNLSTKGNKEALIKRILGED